MSSAWPSVAELGAEAPVAGQLTIRSGVVLNEGQAAFVHALRAVLDPGVPLTVTSGTRTPERQASAMLGKWTAGEARGPGGGAKELHDIYGDDDAISVLLQLPREAGVWAGQIAAWAAQGRLLSRHQRGDAVDLHTASLTTAQRDALIAAAKQLGARTLLESAPPHLHVDLPPAFAGSGVPGAGEPDAGPVETFPLLALLPAPPASPGVPWVLLLAAAGGLAWFAWPWLAPVAGAALTRAGAAALRVIR